MKNPPPPSVALSGMTAAVAIYQCFSASKRHDILGQKERALHEVYTDHKLTDREIRFLQFASIEYDDVIYMSPMDFIDSLTLDAPRERVYRRVLKEDDVKQMLKSTPPFRSGNKRLFRTLDQNGLISYAEYIFLLTLMTKSKSAFKIAFLMFDKDDNGTIDKEEFSPVFDRDDIAFYLKKLIRICDEIDGNRFDCLRHRKCEAIRSLMSSLRSTRGAHKKLADDSCQLDVSDFHFVVSHLRDGLFAGTDSYSMLFTKSEDSVRKQDTTLLLHLFGARGNHKLSFENFRQFYKNLQEEIMEIEFHEFARGKPTISPVDFARLILRYTIINKDDYHKYVNRVKERTPPDDKGVSLGEWARFSVFLNNLEEFSTAVRLYSNADIPVSPLEFSRAVQCTIGESLDPHLVSLIFRIFDANNDQTLSYPELLAVMNDRLHRGLKGKLNNAWGWKPFKNCVINELSHH
ncbi:hypothetical protein KIN20_012158 [Parelaphostrongylus tenuis]|uniref:EF-hand domain-containing protein n=1 Tax=Parelaphostrongylus tenuis TaxID=148309 RepID=A0AAD5MF18_PARTN|nr:hypothetical protein KIN20_012158 [Parelaphostrongylus tenuis]